LPNRVSLSPVRPAAPRAARGAVGVAAALLLAGCALTPKPLTLEENSTRAQQDLASVIDKLEPLKGPLTLADATARALRNNLELRVRQMEAMVQSSQLDLSRYDMLPRLALSAGYNWRDNDAFGVGYTPSGAISTVPSAASERIHNTANAALTWNVLDFGLSYYRARQNADQVLIAEERRRRALQNLVLDVRLAWWRAEAAQRLLPQVDSMLEQIDRSAERSRLIEARRLMPPLQIIAYRRSLLDLQQQLSQRRQDLAQWRTEFAELAGLRPGESYRIATPEPAAFLQLPELASHADDLEAMALERRPELAEERLRVRITQAEGKRQILSLMPNLNLNVGANYDSNRFLVNNQWSEAGSLITFNLLKLLSLPAMKRSQQAAEELDKARREALTMAVMAQTHVAVTRYDLLKHEFGVWNQALADDRALLRAMQATQQSGLETELELIRASARLAITEINRDIVHANLEHAMGRVMNSVGYDVVTADTDASSTPSLSAQLKTAFARFTQDNFQTRAGEAMKSTTIGTIVGVPANVEREFREAMLTVLRVAQVPVSDAKGAAVETDVAVKLGPHQDSGRPVTLKITLADGRSGNMLHVVQMHSMLVEPVTADQWKVLGEAAVFKVAENLRRLLGGRPALPRDTLTLTEGGALKLDRNWSGPRVVPSARP
jgi:outer membrane protein TolC